MQLENCGETGKTPGAAEVREPSAGAGVGEDVRAGEQKREQRPSRRRVRLRAVDGSAHPEYVRDHPFSGMDAGRRAREFVECCAQIWARACEEAARGQGSKSRAAA